ncbi:MAG: WYL domain-containing protein [Clostridia bacterium]|nr:WYL domain-containing protein [Clostridia bacterium]
MKSGLQKRKLLYVAEFLLQNSDLDRPVTMSEILAYLNSNGILSERKSVYDDIAVLNESGLVIEKTADNRGYYVACRDFENAELKLLVDAVASAKFLSVKKSEELIKKIEKLTDKYSAKALQRQVYVLNRAKTANESVYYNVDLIHLAIAENKKITFKYFNYNSKKERVYAREGAIYTVSPWGLVWDDENYYLVATDEGGAFKHYRVDKMTSISQINCPRDTNSELEKFDIALYSKKMFGMFGGEEKTVTLYCHESMAGVIIDRFGKDVFMVPEKDGFTVTVKVAESPIFYSWVFGVGDKVKIISPQKTVDDFIKHLNGVKKSYLEE